MKILNFSVEGLNGKAGVIHAEFNDDINIVTGRNGSGKTTYLKLLWFIISGNLNQAFEEVSFRKITLKTNEYQIKIEKNSDSEITYISLKSDPITLEYKKEISETLGKTTSEDVEDFDHDWFEREDFDSVTREISAFLNGTGASILFPTFRRIEGGFSMKTSSSFNHILRRKNSNDVEEAMSSLSEKFSRQDHKFVSSLSTQDIVQLLLRQYTNLNDKASSFQNEKNLEIIQSLKQYEAGAESELGPISERSILINIRRRIEEIESTRAEIMGPMEAVQKIVAKIFSNTGIKIGGRLNFGDAANAINSDQMSAGEKQLLSFICYNAFMQHSVFIIDEPELSLHVDWQRLFFKILTQQNPSNQFIVATHSPFIYNKYPDKELIVDNDRGDNEGEKQ